MINKLNVALDFGIGAQREVGVLAEVGHKLYFEYSGEFVRDPLPISPFKLPAVSGLVEHKDRDYSPLFGVFSDSLPDGWGLLLMDRAFQKRGLNVSQVSILDRLAYIGKRGMGALVYEPAMREEIAKGAAMNLEKLANEAQRVLEGQAEDVLPELQVAGGSPGGARPKVAIALGDHGHIISGVDEIPDGYKHFIVKFPAKEDIEEIGLVEFVYAQMMKEAGINIPETKLFRTGQGKAYFGVERFDRNGNERLHMHTLGGLFHADHRLPSMDYEDLLAATFEVTKDYRQMEEAFRRMVFNVAGHNRDDHVKNFSYLMNEDGKWLFSPVYDVLYSQGPRGEHTMAIGGEALEPKKENILSVAKGANIADKKAKEIIEEVRSAISSWPVKAKEAGISKRTIEEVQKAINRAWTSRSKKIGRR